MATEGPAHHCPAAGQPDSFFDQGPGDAHRLWTAGFVNERFPQVVSPLGWSLICPLLEELAFRDPLRFLGVHQLDGEAILRLYRGHPYVDVQVFQHLYSAFPDALLPEDAVRFFPEGEVALRKQVPHPRLWQSAFWAALARALWTQWPLWSPWHNARRWAAFERACETALDGLAHRLQQARGQPVTRRVPALGTLLEEAQHLNWELLAIHRWSLTLADVLYSLLRRACHRRWGEQEGTRQAAAWVADVDSVSARMNQALQDLAHWCRQEGGVQALDEGGPAAEALEAFLQQYGHRSHSLDIYSPPFAEDPGQVKRLVSALLQGPSLEPGRPLPGTGAAGPYRPARLLTPLGRLTRIYMRLRESQRFFWQRVLAFQRRAFLDMAQALVEVGFLREAELIFFATWDEVRQASIHLQSLDASRLESRRHAFQRLRREEEVLPPAVAYPPFLAGDTPLAAAPEGRAVLTGMVVSPGVARGPVRIVRWPEDLHRVRPGDILVAPSVDPGWTLVFSNLAGLVLERGGQLSHGAVVAREYRLPALTGVAGAMGRLREGSHVLLDARAGQVYILTEQGTTRSLSTTE